MNKLLQDKWNNLWDVRINNSLFVLPQFLTHFVSQTRLSRFQRDVTSARKRETLILDYYFRFCGPSDEVTAPS